MKAFNTRSFRPLKVVALAGLLALFATLPAPVRASRVRDLSLTEMAAKAGSIFSGRVSLVEAASEHGLPMTRITFEVGEGVKGSPGESLTLTLLGGERPEGLPYRVAGMPRFRVGEEWVLLVYPPSEAGLTSPVGLFQGAFRVSTGLAGTRTVVIPGSRRMLMDDLREAGLMPGKNSAVASTQAATRATSSQSPARGTTVPYTTFMEHLGDLVAGISPAAAASAGRPAPAATDLEAAAAARGAGRRP